MEETKDESLTPFIGVMAVNAKPMSRLAYNELRGWTVPEDENPEDEGYYYIDSNNHPQWRPKEIFEKQFTKTSGKHHRFGEVIEALKCGKLACREGWNGKGMFIMKQIPAEIGLDVIPKMQSVQESAKKVLVERKTTLKYSNQMLIIKADGTADSWVPSSSDVFATDWIIT